jgi:hypothetical protein
VLVRTGEAKTAGQLAKIVRPTYGISLALVPSRDELPRVLNRRGLAGCGVEIGVKLGFFSELLLAEWKGRRLISVDPWLTDDPESYQDSDNVDQEQQDANFEFTKNRLRRFGQRSIVWRMTSLEAASLVPDTTLDFVYIDARHDYDSVKEDLKAWFPKLRPGSILAGHDYLDGVRDEGVYGVRSAVDEFARAEGLRVHCSYQDIPWISWFIEIPADGSAKRTTPALERGARILVTHVVLRAAHASRSVIRATLSDSWGQRRRDGTLRSDG